MSKVHVATLIGVALFGGGLGATGEALHRWTSRGDQSALEPREVILIDEPLQGDPALTNLTLTNRFSAPLTVMSVRGNCRSCTEIRTLAGDSVKTPVDIPPGRSLPLRVKIATAGRKGDQEFAVIADCKLSDARRQFESNIRFHVRISSTAEPAQVLLESVEPGRRYETSVDILDGAGDSVIEVEKVVSTAPERLRSTIQRLDDSVVTFDQGPGQEPIKLRRRYRVFANFVSKENLGSQQDALILHFRDPARNDLMVPFITRFVEPAFRLSPPELVWDPASAGVFRRRVICRRRADAAGDLKILSKPDFAEVKLAAISELETEIAISIPQKPKGTLKDASIRFSIGNSNTATLELPLHVVGISAEREPKP